MPPFSLEPIALPPDPADIRGLACLLVDTVNSGAAVSFLAPLSFEHAENWWLRILSAAPPNAVFLAARDAEGIAGTVQLQPSWAPNQPHHAEIVKLMVHRRARRVGLAARLMQAIEESARAAGFRLLTLDTRRGDAAERLYLRLGWIPAGVIPRFALDPDGSAYHDAVFFYKEI